MSDGDDWRSHRDITRLSSEGLTYITVAGLILTSVFAWVLFRNVSLPPDMIKLEHEYLQSFVLALYYLCWIAGTKFDCATQKLVYLTDPQKRKFPVTSVMVVGMLILVAAGLFGTKDNEKLFSCFLTGLVIANVLAWLHLLTRVIPIIKASAKRYREREYFLGLERLYLVAYYINGRWQWYRFFGMITIVSLLLLVSFSDWIRLKFAAVFSQPATFYAIIPDLILLVFVLFAESWIWAERVRTRLAMSVIDSLDDYYRLIPDESKLKELEEHWKIEDHLRWWKTLSRRSLPLLGVRKKPRRRPAHASGAA